jgi:hypothetical protein
MEKGARREPADSIKTTIELPRALWRAAKIRAMDDGTNLNDVVTAALKLYLPEGR